MHFAEFFAGVGLINEALKDDGWTCLWANDICPEKKETYSSNFSSEEFFLGDVWDCVKNPSVVPSDCFLYTASFPCTDMSLAGSRKGLDGDHSGTLHAVLSVIESKKKSNEHPYLIMLENVQGFLSSNKGLDVALTVRKLNDLGYVVDLIELDAVHFVPQSRPRVFLFAVRSEFAEKLMAIKNDNKILDSWWGVFEANPLIRTNRIMNIVKTNIDLKWGAFNIPPPPKRTLTLSDIIEKDLNEKPEAWWPEDRKEYLFSQMSASHKEMLGKIVNKDEYSYGTVYRRTRQGVSFAELRTDGVAGCLRTPRGGSSKQIVICAGFGSWSVRLLTSREYARLQGVGDHFVLPENANKGYFAMGDAVCVPVIKFISNFILSPSYREIMAINKNAEKINNFNEDIYLKAAC